MTQAAVAIAGEGAVLQNGRRPIDGTLEPVAGFQFPDDRDDFSYAIECLAAAAFYEAGDDPDGQSAVAQVVINRLRHPAYPSSVCGVVFQGWERRTGCQFTFTCDGSLARKPSTAAWERARKTAVAALSGRVDARVGTATHYHADYVVPYWSAGLRKLTQIGAHIFYRWPGSWGGSGAFRSPVPSREFKVAILDPKAAGAPEEITAPGDPPLLQLPYSAVSEPPAFSLSVTSPPPASTSTIVTLADQNLPAGRWAVKAMETCRGREACLLLAYEDPARVERNLAVAPASRDTPLFLFVRDSASGASLALWDCDRLQRPNEAECLPQARQALTRLMRDRG